MTKVQKQKSLVENENPLANETSDVNVLKGIILLFIEVTFKNKTLPCMQPVLEKKKKM